MVPRATETDSGTHRAYKTSGRSGRECSKRLQRGQLPAKRYPPPSATARANVAQVVSETRCTCAAISRRSRCLRKVHGSREHQKLPRQTEILEAWFSKRETRPFDREAQPYRRALRPPIWHRKRSWSRHGLKSFKTCLFWFTFQKSLIVFLRSIRYIYVTLFLIRRSILGQVNEYT